MNDFGMEKWKMTQDQVDEWATVEGWLTKDHYDCPTVCITFTSMATARALANQLLRVPGIAKVTVRGEVSTHVEYQQEERQ